VQQGKVRYIGCSNWQAWKIAKALGICEFRNLARLDTLQAYYSIAGRDLEREILPLLESERVGLLVWSPLAGGLLSGQYSRTHPPIQTTPSRKGSYGWNSPRSPDALSIKPFVKQFAKPDALPGASRADAARKSTRTDSAGHSIRTRPVDSYARSNRYAIESVLRRLREFSQLSGLDNRRA
jgi:aryl-alcohol dehydrogenase-like predicted oxidoreductase